MGKIRVNWNCFFMNAAAAKALAEFAYGGTSLFTLLKNCAIEDAKRMVRQMRDSGEGEEVFRERSKPVLRSQGYFAPKE